GKDYLAGDIHLRALRDPRGDGSNGLGISFGNGVNVAGTSSVVAEAVRIYEQVSNIDSAQIAQYQADTQAYMQSLPAGAHPGLTIMPGIEIRGSGDITLKTHWDFSPVAWTVTDQNGTLVTQDAQGKPFATDANGKPIITDPSFTLGLDFSGQNPWRYGTDHATPGFLTLRAGGNLNLEGKLSDGVAPGVLTDSQGIPGIFDQLIQPGNSWSYRLVAGADRAAADSMRTLPGSGDIDIASGAAVRTGTGNISLGAGGNLVLTDKNSAIYTVGTVDADSAKRFGTYTATDAVNNNFYAEYPTRGGNLFITTGGDIVGAVTDQFVPDWLVRTGNWDPTNKTDAHPHAVAWGIALSQNENNTTPGNFPFFIPEEFRGFKQNLGALAGGNIEISAGGNIKDLSVVIPTVGKQVGARTNDNPDITQSGFKFNQVEVHGGGNLDIKSGGDIAGGMFYVEKGAGTLQANGAIIGGKQYSSGPLFSLGDASLNIKARDGIRVGTVFDPFMLIERNITGDTNYFSTYSDASRVGFDSLAGDIRIENDMAVLKTNYSVLNDNSTGMTTGDYTGLYYYPGNLAVHAWSDSIGIDRPLTLAPDPSGNLELFAENSIQGSSNPATFAGINLVNMSDVDPNTIPNPTRPLGQDFLDRFNPIAIIDTSSQTAPLVHAAIPVHANDGEPVRIATHGGDISSNTNGLWFSLPKPVLFESGNDIRDVNLILQNLSDRDISQVSAQRDLAYSTFRTQNGGLDNGQKTRFWMAGPGKLQIEAGRNIDLGNADGIVSIGNTTNPALPSSGASLAVLAGLAQTPSAGASATPRNFNLDLPGFLKCLGSDQCAYLSELNQVLKLPPDQLADEIKARPELKTIPDLVKLLAGYHIDLSGSNDAAIAALSPQQQLDLALPVLFEQIRLAGVAAAKHGNETRYYQPGFDAINALFPEKNDKTDKGDINLYFSRIQTAFGGDVDLLTPGGLVNAGLTNSPLGAKPSSKLGVVVQQQGAINAFVNNDFTVNESRVFALGGGDITVWSSKGNIDAGKGAKSALSAPPPQTTFDNFGNVTIVYPPVVNGSGIRTASPDGPQEAGNVYLFAPAGVVNAGEAGIGGNNVVIAATAVIGAGNIQFSSSVGVPTTAPPVVVPTSASSAASAAAQSAVQQVSDNASQKSDSSKDKAKPTLGVIQVDLLGFGSCSMEDVRGSKPGCGS
ncbi:MAG: filamentous hemagglutinin family protein, partial [Methylococcaceae bacterium]|nr:filamentous hemagglutinin family protein [Methylococcaceae bacterium]